MSRADSSSRYQARHSAAASFGFTHGSIKENLTLAGHDAAFVDKIVPYLEIALFCEGSDIVKEGDVGGSIYFLHKGEVEVLQDDRHITTMKSGNVFGELALFGGTGKRTATVRALEFCDCRVIHQHNFASILKMFPAEMKLLEELMQKRRGQSEPTSPSGKFRRRKTCGDLGSGPESPVPDVTPPARARRRSWQVARVALSFVMAGEMQGGSSRAASSGQASEPPKAETEENPERPEEQQLPDHAADVDLPSPPRSTEIRRGHYRHMCAAPVCGAPVIDGTMAASDHRQLPPPQRSEASQAACENPQEPAATDFLDSLKERSPDDISELLASSKKFLPAEAVGPAKECGLWGALGSSKDCCSPRNSYAKDRCSSRASFAKEGCPRVSFGSSQQSQRFSHDDALIQDDGDSVNLDCSWFGGDCQSTSLMSQGPVQIGRMPGDTEGPGSLTTSSAAIPGRRPYRPSFERRRWRAASAAIFEANMARQTGASACSSSVPFAGTGPLLPDIAKPSLPRSDCPSPRHSGPAGGNGASQPRLSGGGVGSRHTWGGAAAGGGPGAYNISREQVQENRIKPATLMRKMQQDNAALRAEVSLLRKEIAPALAMSVDPSPRVSFQGTPAPRMSTQSTATPRTSFQSGMTPRSSFQGPANPRTISKRVMVP